MRCWNAENFSGDFKMSFGEIPSAAHNAAAVPDTCPVVAQVFIMRVEENAMWLQLMSRPAMSRFGKSFATREPNGML